MNLIIQGGRIYDSKNNVNGDVRDLFIKDGMIVDGFAGNAEKIIDAGGKAVMAGGIDIHSHIGTYGLNVMRGTYGFYSPWEIGYTYAKMGYTHVNEPFMTQLTASSVHHELSSIPILDTSSFLVLNLRDIEGRIKTTKYIEEVETILGVIMAKTKAIGLKIYEPFVRYAQRMFIMRNVKAQKVLNLLSGLRMESFPRIIMHTSPDLLKEEIENPENFHFSHVGSAMDNEDAYQKILEYISRGASVDLGLFDFAKNLKVLNSKETQGELCGSVDMGLLEPLLFSHSKTPETEAPFLALNLALSEPFKSISFSTDSPTNASFKAYPEIFAWLMKAENREGLFQRELPAFEYSLFDISRITRQNPAGVLGLCNKGHLGVGAEADIAVYDINEETKAHELKDRLSECAFLIKGGEVVIEDHKILNDQPEKKTYYRGIGASDDEAAKILARYSTLRFGNLTVEDVFTAKEIQV
ncbi:MAG: amidohydrolase family protein [Thermodesulfobacteriota bacterium]|nr:amidohydrolase family protein [Thermodesulfobacteriota bacterium]